MPRQVYTASEAARALGISLDTLRRWDRQGRIKTTRDRGNRREVPAEEIERLRGTSGNGGLSARNRLHGVVTEIKIDGLLAQVEIRGDRARPCRRRRHARVDRGARPRGRASPATAVVKSTSVMVER